MLIPVSPTAWLSAGLITWLATLYLVYTDGPPLPRIGPVFLWIRIKAGFRAGLYVDQEWTRLDSLEGAVYNPEDVTYRHDGQWLAQLLACHRCTGFWVGLLIGLPLFGLSIEALSVPALAIFLHELSNR